MQVPGEGEQTLQFHDIREGRDYGILVHKDLFAWCESNVRNRNVRAELYLCFGTFLKKGSFSIHTGRFGACHGGEASKQLREALRGCPYIEQIESYVPGTRCKQYTLRLRSIRNRSDQSTDSGLSASSVYSIGRSYCRQVRIPGPWLLTRAQNWATWCDVNGHELRLDLFGLTRLGKAVFSTLSRLSVPQAVNVLERYASGAGNPAYVRWFHDKLVTGGFLRCLMTKDGRSYHPLSNCPKALRKSLRLDGEPLQEADLSASYWYFLATQLPDCTERDRLVALIREGRFYETIAEASAWSGDERDQLKRECQRQLLFGQDWRASSRPLWSGLKSMFPRLCALIVKLRRAFGGPSGFAKYLMRLEGKLMDAVWHRLIARGVTGIRLHDGMLVAAPNLSIASDLIRRTGLDLFGIEPYVKAK